MKKVAIIFELVGFVVCFLTLGFILDELWFSSGVLPAIGVGLGFFVWIFYLWKKLH